MSTIHIPTDELSDVILNLDEIRNRISDTANLGSVGSDEDVGDGRLAEAIVGFDDAWKAGHERVQDNVDTFKDAAQGIIDSFESTDQDLVSDQAEGSGS